MHKRVVPSVVKRVTEVSTTTSMAMTAEVAASGEKVVGVDSSPSAGVEVAKRGDGHVGSVVGDASCPLDLEVIRGEEFANPALSLELESIDRMDGNIFSNFKAQVIRQMNFVSRH